MKVDKTNEINPRFCSFLFLAPEFVNMQSLGIKEEEERRKRGKMGWRGGFIYTQTELSELPYLAAT